MSIESFIEFGKAAEKAATALGDLSQALDVVSQTPCFTTPLWKENPSVMLSINPKWCELIASGEKTIEIRKTRPKTETPFKCYIYETKKKINPWCNGKGKVIGEFVCKKIDRIGKRGFDNNFDYCYLSLDVFGNDDIEIEITDIKKSCIAKKELNLYGEKTNCLYAWHISDLVFYDKPKELSDFYKHDDSYDNAFGWAFEDREKRIPITRPPQSWWYVEALEDT